MSLALALLLAVQVPERLCGPYSDIVAHLATVINPEAQRDIYQSIDLENTNVYEDAYELSQQLKGHVDVKGEANSICLLKARKPIVDV